MSIACDLLIKNVNIASMQSSSAPYGVIEDAMLAIRDGKIAFVGKQNENHFQAFDVVDAKGHWLLPGLIDCHTHLIYGGNRTNEFEQRLQGKTYEQIAQQGGGIQRTVKDTRNASKESLLTSALQRAQLLIDEGVTCLEIKSGYGLDLENEIKMLEVAKLLEQKLPIKVVSTFLGAHALPADFEGDKNDYIDLVCQQMIPVIAQRQLADCVDVFCESIGFSVDQCKQVFDTATGHGLRIKAHAEQLSNLGGAKLASEYNALSVDHLEYLNEQDVASLSLSDTVAVLLPGAFYYLNETVKPPISALRKYKVPIAVATDLNPGSSPLNSLLTAMNMSAVLFGLTPLEALQGTTINAAKALGLSTKGQLKVGLDADFGLWDIHHPSELSYGINQCRPHSIWVGGHLV